MIKIMKKMLLLTLAISIFITSIPSADARAEDDWGGTYESQTSGESGGVNTDVSIDSYNNGDTSKQYTCSYGYYLKPTEGYSIGIYDMQDNDIMQSDFTIKDEDLPAAGTAVGVNIQERRTIRLGVKDVWMTVYKKKLVYEYEDKYVCTYTTEEPKSLEQDVKENVETKIPIEKNECRNTTKYLYYATNGNPTTNDCIDNAGSYCEATSPTSTLIKEDVIVGSHYEYSTYTYVVGFTEDRNKNFKPTNLEINEKFGDFDSNYYEDEGTTFFDLRDENYNKKITISNKEDIDRMAKCVDNSAARVANYGNYWVYKYPMYDVFMPNSNNTTKNTESIVLDAVKARRTGVYYKYEDELKIENLDEAKLLDDNEILNCNGKNSTCEISFVYVEGDVNGFTYDPGGIQKITIAQYPGIPLSKNDPLLTNAIKNDPMLMEDGMGVDYFHKKDKTCINVKTAEVSYINAGDSCKKNEYEISNTIIEENGKKYEHWHYFIPLNTKSIDGTFIKFQTHYIEEYNSMYKLILSTNECIKKMQQYYIEKNDEISNHSKYTEMYKPSTAGDVFAGDYYCLGNCGTKDAVFTTSSRDYDTVVANGGCYAVPEKKFNIKQLFYNETTTKNSITNNKETKFNGFNFYYKPIDISKDNQVDIIFPNGTTNLLGQFNNKTLWDDWYEAQKDPHSLEKEKTPDLSKSFEKTTYLALNINAGEVRAYNKDNPYTDWSNMNLNGTSKYISDEGIITRNGVQKVYKLGCGPLNENEYLDEAKTQINLLYRKECAT